MIVKNLLKSSRALTAKTTGHLKHLKHGCLMPVKKTFHLSMIMSWRSRGRTHVITQSPQNLKFDGICVARSTCMWAAGISLSLSFSRIMHHFRLPPIQPQLEFHPRYRPSLRWSTEIAPSGFRRRKPSKHCRLLWHPPDKTTFAREFFD